MTTVHKGDWVRAQWFDAKQVSLSGAQMKTGATLVEVEGTVTHIRGDHPTNPTSTSIRLWVKQADGTEVVVNPDHVIDYRAG